MQLVQVRDAIELLWIQFILFYGHGLHAALAAPLEAIFEVTFTTLAEQHACILVDLFQEIDMNSGLYGVMVALSLVARPMAVRFRLQPILFCPIALHTVNSYLLST